MTVWLYSSMDELEIYVGDPKTSDKNIEASTVGNFFSPVWLEDGQVILAGHYGYADDDIEAFGDGAEWSPELVQRVGAKLKSLTAESSELCGAFEVVSGCLLLTGSEEIEISSSEIDNVVANQETHATEEFVLVPIPNGTYQIRVDELDEIDDELGTFQGRIVISKLNS